MKRVTIDPADRLFSIWVRLRDSKCVRCGSPVELNAKGLPVSLQCSHFMGRGKEATRFEPLNCDALCGGCHLYFTANPAAHYVWQVTRKGRDVVQDLILMSNLYKRKDRAAEAIYWRKRVKDDFGIAA